MSQNPEAGEAMAAENEPLVMAMPRRELFRVNGFTTRVDLGVMESLAEEAWFAAPSTLSGNFDAKEVRLGLVVTRADQVLISEQGCLLHMTPIMPEVANLGVGLRALRELAVLAGRQFLGGVACQVELLGYCNDDAMADIRPFFILVYRCQAAGDCAAPEHMSWVSRQQLAAFPLDPVSAMVSGALAPNSGKS
jgi:hypothetical protein